MEQQSTIEKPSSLLFSLQDRLPSNPSTDKLLATFLSLEEKSGLPVSVKRIIIASWLHRDKVRKVLQQDCMLFDYNIDEENKDTVQRRREVVFRETGTLSKLEGRAAVIHPDERQHQRTMPTKARSANANPAMARIAERRPRTPRANRAQRMTAKTTQAMTGKISFGPQIHR